MTTTIYLMVLVFSIIAYALYIYFTYIRKPSKPLKSVKSIEDLKTLVSNSDHLKEEISNLASADLDKLFDDDEISLAEASRVLDVLGFKFQLKPKGF